MAVSEAEQSYDSDEQHESSFLCFLTGVWATGTTVSRVSLLECYVNHSTRTRTVERMASPSELSVAATLPVLDVAAPASRETRSIEGPTYHATAAAVVPPCGKAQQVCQPKSYKPASCKQLKQIQAPHLSNAIAADGQGSSIAATSHRRVARTQSTRRCAPIGNTFAAFNQCCKLEQTHGSSVPRCSQFPRFNSWWARSAPPATPPQLSDPQISPMDSRKWPI